MRPTRRRAHAHHERHDDQRGTLIALTDAGRALIDRVTGPHLENERRLVGSLSDAEQAQLADLLRKLMLGLPPLERRGAR